MAAAAIWVFSFGHVIPGLHVRVAKAHAFAASGSMGSTMEFQSGAVRKNCRSGRACWHRGAPDLFCSSVALAASFKAVASRDFWSGAHRPLLMRCVACVATCKLMAVEEAKVAASEFAWA
eukprot:4690406-Pyramimonas_sp.AAC.1